MALRRGGPAGGDGQRKGPVVCALEGRLARGQLTEADERALALAREVRGRRRRGESWAQVGAAVGKAERTVAEWEKRGPYRVLCAYLERAEKQAAGLGPSVGGRLAPVEVEVVGSGPVSAKEKAAGVSAERVWFRRLVPVALRRLEGNLLGGFDAEGNVTASKVADEAMALCLKGSGLLEEEGRTARPIHIDTLVIQGAAREIVAEDRRVVDVTPEAVPA